MRVLVAEDDPDVGEDLKNALVQAGFVVDLVTNGESAWYQGDVEEYSAVILDLGLPILDGLAVLRNWRSQDRMMPVIVLSARGDWAEKVEGIEAGADDYLSKPFKMEELLSRLRALIRRTGGHASSVLVFDNLRIDTRRMSVSVSGTAAQLSQMEFRLVNFLAHNVGRVVPTGEIAEHLYGSTRPGDTNAIEALIMRTRKKIGSQKITNRRGFGYSFVAGSA